MSPDQPKAALGRETGADSVDARSSKLGGEDSNPQQMDQNHPCYQLHHPRRASERYRLERGWHQTTPSSGIRLAPGGQSAVADDAANRDCARFAHVVAEGCAARSRRHMRG